MKKRSKQWLLSFETEKAFLIDYFKLIFFLIYLSIKLNSKITWIWCHRYESAWLFSNTHCWFWASSSDSDRGCSWEGPTRPSRYGAASSTCTRHAHPSWTRTRTTSRTNSSSPFLSRLLLHFCLHLLSPHHFAVGRHLGLLFRSKMSTYESSTRIRLLASWSGQIDGNETRARWRAATRGRDRKLLVGNRTWVLRSGLYDRNLLLSFGRLWLLLLLLLAYWLRFLCSTRFFSRLELKIGKQRVALIFLGWGWFSSQTIKLFFNLNSQKCLKFLKVCIFLKFFDSLFMNNHLIN